MQAKLKLIASAIALAASSASFGATPIGTLAPDAPLVYSSGLSGSFLHELSFTLLANGADFNGVVSSSFTGSATIKNFAATLSGPDGYLASWDYTQQAAPKYQLLTDSELFLQAGAYVLTVSGIGQRSDSYTVDLSIAAVPEPETYALMFAGLAAIGFVAQRRRRID